MAQRKERWWGMLKRNDGVRQARDKDEVISQFHIRVYSGLHLLVQWGVPRCLHMTETYARQ